MRLIVAMKKSNSGQPLPTPGRPAFPGLQEDSVWRRRASATAVRVGADIESMDDRPEKVGDQQILQGLLKHGMASEKPIKGCDSARPDTSRAKTLLNQISDNIPITCSWYQWWSYTQYTRAPPAPPGQLHSSTTCQCDWDTYLTPESPQITVSRQPQC